MIVQLYRTNVKNPEALVLDFTTDLIAEMFLPISKFFEDNRIRLKSISTDKLELTIEYYQGDNVVAMHLKDATYYLVTLNGYSVLALKDEDLEASSLSTRYQGDD